MDCLWRIRFSIMRPGRRRALRRAIERSQWKRCRTIMCCMKGILEVMRGLAGSGKGLSVSTRSILQREPCFWKRRMMIRQWQKRSFVFQIFAWVCGKIVRWKIRQLYRGGRVPCMILREVWSTFMLLTRRFFWCGCQGQGMFWMEAGACLMCIIQWMEIGGIWSWIFVFR